MKQAPKAKTVHGFTLRNNIVRVALVTVLILLVPFIAMQFTDEVTWGLLDFAIAGVLLFGAGLMFELAARTTRNNTYRIAIAAALGLALLLTWAELAVGIFD